MSESNASRAAWIHAMMAAYREAGRQLNKQRKGRLAAEAAKEAEQKLVIAEKAFAEAVAAKEAADKAAAATLTAAQRAEAEKAAAQDAAAREAKEKAEAEAAAAREAAAREAAAKEAAAKEAAAKEAAAKAEAEAAAAKEAAARDAAEKEAAAKEAAAMLAAEEEAAREAAEKKAAVNAAAATQAAAHAFVAYEERPHDQSGIGAVFTIFKAIVYSALLVAYLVLEVLVAMLAYMYLNLYQIQTFGYLIGLSHRLLNEFAIQLEKFSPTIANQAYATILGELGAKSILLLFIGLAVSAGIRFLLWLVNEGVELLFRARHEAPARPEVRTSVAA